MCHSCTDCNSAPRNCKIELKLRLLRALEIVDEMEGDTFTRSEIKPALELYDLLENIQRDHIPEIEAWCSVKVYAKVHGEAESTSMFASSNDAVWNGYPSKRIAEQEAKKTQAHYKAEHERHPWWGPWKTCGDRFVARLTQCSVGQLKHGMTLPQPRRF